MSEINLLPTDLRDQEERERDAARKKAHPATVPLSSPVNDKIPSPVMRARPSLLSRLFAKKVASPKMPRLDTMPSDRRIFAESPLPKVDVSPVATTPEVKVSAPTSDTLPTTAEPAPLPLKPAVAPVVKKSEPKKRWSLFKRKKTAPTTETNTVDAVGGGLDVNLIPLDLARQPELDARRRLAVSGLWVFVTLIVVVIIYLGMTWYQVRVTREITQLENELAVLGNDIDRAAEEKQKAVNLQQRLGLIRDLLDHHTYWTKFFELLEQHTIRDVYYVNFAMAGTDGLTIAAVAKDYRAVAEQLVAFEQATDFIKDVRIDSASSEIDAATGVASGVTFNINLEFVPGIFNKPL